MAAVANPVRPVARYFCAGIVGRVTEPVGRIEPKA